MVQALADDIDVADFVEDGLRGDSCVRINLHLASDVTYSQIPSRKSRFSLIRPRRCGHCTGARPSLPWINLLPFLKYKYHPLPENFRFALWKRMQQDMLFLLFFLIAVWFLLNLSTLPERNHNRLNSYFLFSFNKFEHMSHIT